MTKREFNKQLKTCLQAKSKLLDPAKVLALSVETRTAMAHFIIRNRAPLMVEFLTDTIDQRWLVSMGYLYRTKGKHFTFCHTSEHVIR